MEIKEQNIKDIEEENKIKKLDIKRIKNRIRIGIVENKKLEE